MSRVAVLMSTYNGELFIREQLESILTQQGVGLSISVRDDGSTDATLSILQEFGAGNKINIDRGLNFGPARSFFSLLGAAPLCDFYSYADQDDIWLPDKIWRALQALQFLDQDVPLLYLSNATKVDAMGKPLGSLVHTRKQPGLGNALVQCFSIGATMVFNHAARKLLIERAMPVNPVMHDWWTYLLVSSFGNVIYDPEPTMLYRQHGQNVYGGTGSVEYIRGNWQDILRSQKMRLGREQARDLMAIYPTELTSQTRERIEEFTRDYLGMSALCSALSLQIYKKQPVGSLVAKLQWAACSY